MLYVTEAQATGLQKQAKLEKKLREKAEASSSSVRKAMLIAEERLENMKTAFEGKKEALLKHVEEAEGQLKPVTEELNTLKHHITNMTVAIFGKS